MTKPVPNGTADGIGVSNHEESDTGPLPEIEPLLSTRAYAALTGRAVQTVRIERMRGGGPPYIRHRGRAYYHPADIREWLRARRFQSTAEETVAREAQARSAAKAKRGRGGAK